MKKLIFRKIVKDITIFFILMSTAIGIIVWTLQAVNYLDFVVEDGHGFKTYFLYSIYNFPKIVNRLVPFIFFISLLYVITNYDSKNELIIFWTNGVSKNEFVKILLSLSVVLTILQIIISGYISPLSQYKGRSQLKDSNIDYFASLIKKGKFLNIVDGLTIFINSKDSNDNFINIFIDDSSKSNTKIIYAKNGFIESDSASKKFKLFNGEVINKNKSEINVFKFDEIDFNLSDFTSGTILVPKIQELSSQKLFNCYFAIKKEININFNNNDFLCEKNIKKNIQQELLKRFYKPLYIPVISLLSCFLIVLSKSNINYKKNKYRTASLIFLTLIISEGSLRYSTSSNITTTVYLLLPIILFILIYYFLKKRLRHV